MSSLKLRVLLVGLLGAALLPAPGCATAPLRDREGEQVLRAVASRGHAVSEAAPAGSSSTVTPPSILVPVSAPATARLHRSPSPLWSTDPVAVHEKPCWCENRFRFTTIRAWFFQDFVPNRDDPTTLGLEFNSQFGVGRFDVTNISYFEVARYPVAVPGRPAGNEFPQAGSADGINDLLTAFLFSKKGGGHGPHHFAAGVAAQFPTATDGTLGSGKWSVGPAVEYEYHKGRFMAAFVALNVFSFAGDADRKNVNMFMLKPMITYELNRCWKAVYMPYGVSIYWEKKPEDAVYLPLGGGIQRDFKIGSQQMAASVQLFTYVMRPAGGSQHDLRFMLEFDF